MRTLKQRKYALHFPKGEGRTEQAHAGETDINQIMAKAMRGEHSDYIQKHEPQYGDATGPDYLEAQIIVANAKTMFEDLPAKIRSKFNHNPDEFLEFVQDPKNDKEMVELKLKNPPPPLQVEKTPEMEEKQGDKTEPEKS